MVEDTSINHVGGRSTSTASRSNKNNTKDQEKNKAPKRRRGSRRRGSVDTSLSLELYELQLDTAEKDMFEAINIAMNKYNSFKSKLKSKLSSDDLFTVDERDEAALMQQYQALNSKVTNENI